MSDVQEEALATALALEKVRNAGNPSEHAVFNILWTWMFTAPNVTPEDYIRITPALYALMLRNYDIDGFADRFTSANSELQMQWGERLALPETGQDAQQRVREDDVRIICLMTLILPETYVAAIMIVPKYKKLLYQAVHMICPATMEECDRWIALDRVYAGTIYLGIAMAFVNPDRTDHTRLANTVLGHGYLETVIRTFTEAGSRAMCLSDDFYEQRGRFLGVIARGFNLLSPVNQTKLIEELGLFKMIAQQLKYFEEMPTSGERLQDSDVASQVLFHIVNIIFMTCNCKELRQRWIKLGVPAFLHGRILNCEIKSHHRSVAALAGQTLVLLIGRQETDEDFIPPTLISFMTCKFANFCGVASKAGIREESGRTLLDKGTTFFFKGMRELVISDVHKLALLNCKDIDIIDALIKGLDPEQHSQDADGDGVSHEGGKKSAAAYDTSSELDLYRHDVIETAAHITLHLALCDEGKERISASHDAVMASLQKLAASQEPALKKARSTAQTIFAVFALEKTDDADADGGGTRADSNGGSRGRTSAINQTSPQVMLSYSWAQQHTVKRIRKALATRGVQVWIDIEQMQGSTIDCMAAAVESSIIILYCVSTTYKESANCRLEASYAHQLKKKMIPLVLEVGYRPNGWLGIMMGTRLYYDFTGAIICEDAASDEVANAESELESKINELCREIQSSLPFVVRNASVQPLLKAAGSDRSDDSAPNSPTRATSANQTSRFVRQPQPAAAAGNTIGTRYSSASPPTHTPAAPAPASAPAPLRQRSLQSSPPPHDSLPAEAGASPLRSYGLRRRHSSSGRSLSGLDFSATTAAEEESEEKAAVAMQLSTEILANLLNRLARCASRGVGAESADPSVAEAEGGAITVDGSPAAGAADVEMLQDGVSDAVRRLDQVQLHRAAVLRRLSASIERARADAEEELSLLEHQHDQCESWLMGAVELSSMEHDDASFARQLRRQCPVPYPTTPPPVVLTPTEPSDHAAAANTSAAAVAIAFGCMVAALLFTFRLRVIN